MTQTVVSDIDISGLSSLKAYTPSPAPQEEAVTPPPAQPTPELVEVKSTRVDLLDSAVRVEISPGLHKLISYTDFLELIKSNLDIKDGTNKQGVLYWLPTGTFYLKKTEAQLHICTYHPESIQPVNYRGTIRPSVVPNIIVSTILSKASGEEYRLQECRYYATRDPLGAVPREFISTANGVSILPFTNVYEDGRLCYGSGLKISSYKMPDLRGVHSLYQVLFDAPFNDDLGLAALKNRFARDEYWKWYDHLADLATKKLPFPYSELRVY